MSREEADPQKSSGSRDEEHGAWRSATVPNAALGKHAIIPAGEGRAKQTRAVGAQEFGWV